MNIYKITFIIFLILAIIILLNMLIKTFSKENFDDFSPYIGYRGYPFVYLKNRDHALLEKKLKEWETPINTHNEGYLNAEPCGMPPLVPLYSYDEMKDIRFKEE